MKVISELVCPKRRGCTHLLSLCQALTLKPRTLCRQISRVTPFASIAEMLTSVLQIRKNVFVLYEVTFSITTPNDIFGPNDSPRNPTGPKRPDRLARWVLGSCQAPTASSLEFLAPFIYLLITFTSTSYSNTSSPKRYPSSPPRNF